jgi:precorrin-6B methylase 2
MTKLDKVNKMTKTPVQLRMILPVILFLALLLPLVPLLTCMDARAYMDTERSVKLDAPFLPTPNYVILELLAKARVGKDDILYDLGSGDGRIVIEAARQTGCRAVGIEIDADLVDDSRQNAVRASVQDRVRFIVADIFKEDFSEATVVTLYMGQNVNLRLRPKLLRELKPGTRIASYSFDMGEWKPDDTSSFGREDAYFWIIPANASGNWRWIEGRGKSKTQWELEVKQAFQEIAGEVSYKGKRFPLQGGKMTGTEIRFTLDGDPFGKGAPVEFTGRIQGNSIEGTIGDGTSRRPWKATRNPATVQTIAR